MSLPRVEGFASLRRPTALALVSVDDTARDRQLRVYDVMRELVLRGDEPEAALERAVKFVDLTEQHLPLVFPKATAPEEPPP